MLSDSALCVVLLISVAFHAVDVPYGIVFLAMVLHRKVQAMVITIPISNLLLKSSLAKCKGAWPTHAVF